MQKFRQQEKQTIQLKRQARNHGNFYVEAEPKVAFVVRIRGYFVPFFSLEFFVDAAIVL